MFFPQARGSPDGGVPAEEPSSSSASEGSEPTDVVEPTESAEGGRVELPAERLLHARAGWLQRRGAGGWSRHWFVLRGAALLYFRDPHAEHRGLMDGVIDLSGISRVVELPTSASTNGYAFETEVRYFIIYMFFIYLFEYSIRMFRFNSFLFVHRHGTESI